METRGVNSHLEKAREKAKQLCLEGKKQDSSEIWSSLLNELVSCRTWDIALKYGKKCMDQLPEFPVGYFFAGVAYLNLQKYDKAMAHLSKVLELQPGNDEAKKNLSMTLYVMEHYEEALEYAIELRQTDLYNPEYIKLVADNLVMLGKMDKAFNLIEEGLIINPKNCDLILDYAFMLSYLGKTGEAFKQYKIAESLTKSEILSSQSLSNLILIHMNRGEMRKNILDKKGGTDEQNMGYVLMELEKIKAFEFMFN